MISRIMIVLVAITFTVSDAIAQRGGDTFNPLPQRTVETDREALRLMRNDKLDLVLPDAMRDNNVDMWIHVTRQGDPLAPYFGSTFGRTSYLIFTDLGDRIERAVFGGPGISGYSGFGFGGAAGAVENIDIQGSLNVARAFSGYNYNNTDPSQGFSIPEVYEEITDFVAERDPQTIAVNFSKWLPEADGISYTQYLQLEEILGPQYSRRIVSAENLIIDFVVRRTSREVAAQTEVLALARQRSKQKLSEVIPGVTTIADINARVYYSAVNTPDKTVSISTPDVRWFIHNPDYVLQRGDLFVGGEGGPGGNYMGFDVDTKIHAYILREGETKVPDFLQEVYDLAIAGQWIMRDGMKVGMTSGESLAAMVELMEEAGYIYTPFIDDGIEDYKIIQKALANTDKPGFSIDNHGCGIVGQGDIGASMAPFRKDKDHLVIQENNLFAYEYMVHKNIDERPGYPLAFNISNPQVITSKGVEFIQPPNEEILLIY